jgi:hypothetical protein
MGQWASRKPAAADVLVSVVSPQSAVPTAGVLAGLRISPATMRAAQPDLRLLPPLGDEHHGPLASLRLRRRLTGELRSGRYQAHPAHIVAVPKESGGTRPAALLRLDDRLVYEALVASLKPQIERVLCSPQIYFGPRGTKTSRRWLSFERAVLHLRPRWVLVADVADYYASIRHGVIVELLREARAGAAADALGSLLGTVMGTDRGLPQGPAASHPVSGVGLVPVDRAMIAGGWGYVRCSDDLRIALDNASDADRAMVALDRELHAVGLRLQGEKTRVLRGDVYERSLSLGARWEVWMWNHVAPLLEGRLHPRLDSLGAAVLRRARATPWGVAAATTRLSTFLTERDHDFDRQAAISAFAILVTARSPAVLRWVGPMLERCPGATPIVAGCLHALAAERERCDVVDVIDGLLSDAVLLPAQRAWLLWALRPVAHSLPSRIVTRACESMAGDEWVLRVQAAWLLALRGELDAGMRARLEATVPAALRTSLPSGAALRRASSRA